MLRYYCLCLITISLVSANALFFDDTDYFNGQIGTGLVGAATSFAVNEVRSDGWWIGVTTSLTYSICRSCDRQILPNDRLFLLTDIYQRSLPSDNYDSILESGRPRLQFCASILTVESVTPPAFQLNYMECTNDTSDKHPLRFNAEEASSRRRFGGWTAVDANLDSVVSAALFAADAFNQQSNAYRRFALHYVTSASSQVVAGINYRIDVILRSTSCRKNASDKLKSLVDCDLVEEQSVEFQRCSFTVWDQAWSTPRYQLNKHECNSAGQATINKNEAVGWFESVSSRFKLGDSQWVLIDSTSKVSASSADEVEDNNIAPDTKVLSSAADTDWFAMFVLVKNPSAVASKFLEFVSRNNKSYSLDADSYNLRYFRFTQNAARNAVARLGNLGTADYNLVRSSFSDLSLSEFCSYLSAQSAVDDTDTETGEMEVGQQWSFLQFYTGKVVHSWSAIFDTTVYKLVGDSKTESACSRVPTRMEPCLLSVKYCRKYASYGSEPCSVSICPISTANSNSSSSNSFTYLSAGSKSSD